MWACSLKSFSYNSQPTPQTIKDYNSFLFIPNMRTLYIHGNFAITFTKQVIKFNPTVQMSFLPSD